MDRPLTPPPNPLDSIVETATERLSSSTNSEPAARPNFPELPAPRPRPRHPSPFALHQKLEMSVSESPRQRSKMTITGPVSNGPPIPRSRAASTHGTPKMQPSTPILSPPRPSTGDGTMLAGVSAAMDAHQRSSPPDMNMSRPLNVTDALSYLDAVKHQFHTKPDVYNHFLDIMKDFKSQVIDTPGVIERVSTLFHGNPLLIQGFNTFLPPGYRIDISADPNSNMITVTTPSGTTTQSSNAFGYLPRTPRDVNHPPPFGVATLPPLNAGPISRSITPQSYQLSQMQGPFDGQSGYASNFQIPSTTAAATFLGGLNGRNPVEKQPAGEFNHAIQYLNKIKARYSDDPNTYKQFLEILQTYQKEQRHLQDSQVYVQVQMLFKDAPDLLSEFKDFLPEAVGTGGAAGGAIGILPHPGGPGAPSPWGALDTGLGGSNERADKNLKKPIPPVRKRRRPAEKDPTPVPPSKTSSGRSKKVKHHHRGEPGSPTFSPYQGIASPQYGHAHTHLHPHSVTQAPQQQTSFSAHSHIPPAHAGLPDELLFFDQAKKALEGRETYDEFLKLLNLYSKEVIDVKILVNKAQVFLGDGDLLNRFKDLVGWDDKQGNIDYGPPGSIRTGPPEALSALPADDGEGPSYRRLPDNEIRLACSGRDELCRSVLNDEWVSHPTWASEDAGFITHKKNTFEEALHKSEEERHEYHIHIEGLTRTIAVLEPINARIAEMTQEERAAFKLNPDFGGSSKSIYHRLIKKVYGREAGPEVIQGLQECPTVAVPVVLARLKQKTEEWRRARREWSRTWREVDAKNFYKSLDHQGISFKANDKKNITAKHFVADIEGVKAEQTNAQDQVDGQRSIRGSVGFQLEYVFQDTSVLHDSLKMVYSFLDHSQAQYSTQERRAVEKFLRSFIPLLCMYPAAEFNAACGPLDSGQDDDDINGTGDGHRSVRRLDNGGGVAANDLRKKLLKTVQDKSLRREDRMVVGSQAGSPIPECCSAPDGEASGLSASIDHDGQEDVWIKEATTTDVRENPQLMSSRKPVFVNTTFYTLLRLIQLLYSRLLICKATGEALAKNKHRHLLANPTAIELGLDEPNGPPAVLAQAMEALVDHTEGDEPNVVYMYLLEACEKVFVNEMDQTTFEEHMRWFFGNKAFHVFTLDKLMTALVKQVQTILTDNKCQELWGLMQNSRNAEKLTHRDKIRYRREAECHVGSDDHLYRIEWERETKKMRMQLVGVGDPSVDEDGTALGRWREYVDTYMLGHATEWMPTGRGERTPFLRRCLPTEKTPFERRLSTKQGLAVRVSLGTYKIFYEANTEDCIIAHERDGTLVERAERRAEERSRYWLKIERRI